MTSNFQDLADVLTSELTVPLGYLRTEYKTSNNYSILQ